MLATNDNIATTAEPWILLPFWGMREPMQGRAIYAHQTAANAINDFISNMPHGEKIFHRAAAAYAKHMYDGAANGKRYFLDKTPRYYLLLPILERLFPDAKIILLVRNPLAVLASICKTFYKGRFIWSDYWVDWNDGHARLAEAAQTPAENKIVVRYEELVSHPAKVIRNLCDWIDIPYDDRMIHKYRSNALHGRMGDPTGVQYYKGINTSSLVKWQRFFNTAFRLKVARKMLEKIGDERLTLLGYPRAQLDAMLESLNTDRSLDMRGRMEYLIGIIASSIDYRYWQSRHRGARAHAKYAQGYYRKTSTK